MARRLGKDSGPARPPQDPDGIAPMLTKSLRSGAEFIFTRTRRRGFVADNAHQMLRGDVVDAVHATRIGHQDKIGEAGRCTITLATRSSLAETRFLAQCDGRMDGCQEACNSLIEAIKVLPLDPPTQD